MESLGRVAGGTSQNWSTGANGVLGLSSGTLTANRDLAVDGAFNWSGGRLRGIGNTIVGNTGVLAISGDADKLFSRYQLTNFGAATWSGTGSIVAGNGAIFRNAGSFAINNDATFGWDGILPHPEMRNILGGILTKSANGTLRHYHFQRRRFL
jgi:hypothetical protein